MGLQQDACFEIKRVRRESLRTASSVMKGVLESPRHASEEFAAAVRLQHALTYLLFTSSDSSDVCSGDVQTAAHRIIHLSRHER